MVMLWVLLMRRATCWHSMSMIPGANCFKSTQQNRTMRTSWLWLLQTHFVIVVIITILKQVCIICSPDIMIRILVALFLRMILIAWLHLTFSVSMRMPIAGTARLRLRTVRAIRQIWHWPMQISRRSWLMLTVRSLKSWKPKSRSS